jgi:uridylate kinase
MPKPARVLIKISGEAMMGEGRSGALDIGTISRICEDLRNLREMGIAFSVVIGGGNIIRGKCFDGKTSIEKKDADYIGMMATVVNGLALAAFLEKVGIRTAILSPFELPFGIRRADTTSIADALAQEKTIVFVGGTGMPFFSTDTVCVVYAALTKSELIMKATKVDGVYDRDPRGHEEASFIESISFEEAATQGLEIMDRTAFYLAGEHKIPIMVFSILEENPFTRAITRDLKTSIIKDKLIPYRL